MDLEVSSQFLWKYICECFILGLQQNSYKRYRKGKGRKALTVQMGVRVCFLLILKVDIEMLEIQSYEN